MNRLGAGAGWILVGFLACYLLLVPEEPPVSYSEVIVPARVIEEREPPPREPTIIERVRFVTVEARVTARAPGGAAENVTAFCRPEVVLATATDSAPELPPPTSLVRSGRYEPSIWPPWGRGSLFLSSLTSHGDLVAQDFDVRPWHDFRAADSIVVRQPRAAWARQVAQGALWYGVFRLVEIGVRAF